MYMLKYHPYKNNKTFKKHLKTFKELLSYILIMQTINLLDLDDDILNIIGGYVKKDNLDNILKEKMKQDLVNYVDIQMKIERKDARKRKFYISRRDLRSLIWGCFVDFCSNHIGIYFMNSHDMYGEITKMYNEYLTSKKLNLKE